MKRSVFKLTFVISAIFLGAFTLHGQTDSGTLIEMTNTETYQPSEVVIEKGEQITWLNKSDKIQTITVKTEKDGNKVQVVAPKDAEPFSSGAIKPGESFSYTFFIPGTYELISLSEKNINQPGRVIVKE